MSRGWQIALGLAAALSLLASFALPAKEAAHLWEQPTFFAWFGLVGCVAIIVVSKALGKLWLQRPEGYYEGLGAPDDADARGGREARHDG